MGPHSHSAPPAPAPAYNGPPISSLAKRIHGWSWQAFPIGMGTGAVYITLSGLHQHATWVTGLEVFFYFLNIAFFLINTTTLLLQFILYRNQFTRLLYDPVKGIFVPLVVLSFATILIGTVNYAVPGGHISPGVIYVLFWVYVSLAVLVCFPMLMIWYNGPHEISEFTPAYAFLIFPMMLVGVVAFNVLRVIEPADPRSIGILLVGYFFQGIGTVMTFFYLNIYILRIMTTGFLEGHQANGAFVACGPPGFTALALIRLGQNAQKILPTYNLISPMAGEIWYAFSVLVALMLFGVAVFFFLFGALPYWFKLHKHLHQILGCWAVTFPNVGWISAVKLLGDIFDIHGFYVVHAIMACFMVTAWLILIFLTGMAFWRGKIFYSGDYDVIRDSSLMDGMPGISNSSAPMSSMTALNSQLASQPGQGHSSRSSFDRHYSRQSHDLESQRV